MLTRLEQDALWDLPRYQPRMLLLLGQAHDAPTPHHPGYLHDALGVLAPPDHQGSHEQRDCDGEHDEGAEDAVGRVLKCSARNGALAEVEMVDCDEEFVHFRVRPETADIVCHVLSAESEVPIAPVGKEKTLSGTRPVAK